MGMYGRYVWYQDRKRKEVAKAGTFIRRYGIQPKNNPDKFELLGEWFDHEQTPFEKDGKAYRMYRGTPYRIMKKTGGK